MTKIGIIIADTTNYALANNALVNTIQKINPEHVITFTDHPDLWNEYDKHLIPKIQNIKEYEKIVLQTTVDYLKLDHYLVIQYDGFVLDANRFDPHFLDFDYIGAPWPHLDNNNVGNGGFSLRSRRLMEAVAENVELKNENDPEDIFICRSIRGMLESKYDVKFPPQELAQRFSFEMPFQTRQTFGFHGVHNLPIVYQNNLEFLFENLPDDFLKARRNQLYFSSLFVDDETKQKLFKLMDF